MAAATTETTKAKKTEKTEKKAKTEKVEKTEKKTAEQAPPPPRKLNPKPATNFSLLSRKSIVDDAGDNVRGFGKGIDVESEEFKALLADIEENGVKLPIQVREAGGGTYTVVSGFRRLKASDLAGFDRVPCIIEDFAEVPETETRVEHLRQNIVENTLRADLKPAELAFGLVDLKNAARTSGKKLTNAELASMIKVSEGHVANLIRCAECLIPPILKAFKGEGGVPLTLKKAIQFSSMDKDEQRTQWDAYVGRLKSAEGEGDDEAKPKDESNKPPRMARRDEVEHLFDNVKVIEAIKLGGKWVDLNVEGTYTGAQLMQALTSVLRWTLDRSKPIPVKLPEEETEESAEE